MENDDQIRHERTRQRDTKALARSLAWPAAALVLSLLVWASLFWRPTTPPPQPPVFPQPSTKLSPNFYDSRIAPLERDNQQANRAAAARCISRIEEHFKTYRDGVGGFCNDITGMGTRFGVLRRMPANWWYEHDSITPYITRKFEKHIYREEQLRGDVGAALTTFRDDLRANRGTLLSGVKVAVSESTLPHLAIPDSESFDKHVMEDLTAFAADRAKDSVYNGVVTLVASEVAAVAASEIVTTFMSTFVTTAAVDAAAAGGATLTTTTAGGAGGTVAGPLGTAIGAGVGLVVGVLVDWWMTDSFKAQLHKDLDAYLDKLKDGIIDGTGGKSGLRGALAEYCDDLHAAQARILHEQLVGGSK
jgi:hypothetical protein